METLSGRTDLELPELDDPPANPLPLLAAWLHSARERGVREPNAMALATGDAGGQPSNRIVLLKQWNDALVFTAHRDSRKGRDLESRPWASGVLYWRETLQQVVIAGPVEELRDADSDALFADRPRAAQAASIASDQSRPVEDPAALRAAAHELADGDTPLARPEDWCGYRLDPAEIEFWHGSPNRLHRRLRYTREAGAWSHERLQP